MAFASDWGTVNPQPSPEPPSIRSRSSLYVRCGLQGRFQTKDPNTNSSHIRGIRVVQNENLLPDAKLLKVSTIDLKDLDVTGIRKM